MRLLFIILIALISETSGVSAQQTPGVLRVRFDDRQALTIAINDRRFPKAAASFTVGDLPRGRNQLDVYEYRPYRDGGGHARLVFSGRIRIRPGMVTYCIVERTTGRTKIFMRERGSESDISDPIFDEGVIAIATVPNNQPEETAHVPLSADSMKTLGQQTAGYIADTDKIAHFRAVLADKTVTVAQVRKMLSWLGAETSRLAFAQWVIDHVSDPEAFLSLEDSFIYEQSHLELRRIAAEAKL